MNTKNGHIIRTYKTRTGWGKWGIVEVYKCHACNNEIKMRKNWSGSRPKGAFVCDCGNQITI